MALDLSMLRLPSEGLPLGADLFSDLDLSVPDWLPSAPKQFQEMIPTFPVCSPKHASASPKGPLHLRLSSASASDSESDGEAHGAHGDEDAEEDAEEDPSFGSKPGSLTSQDSEAAARVRRSARLHRGGADQVPKTKEKRKVGRPIAWVGDPNSPDLTPQERRRIKRRIANRESARRVRARRQDMLEEMIEKAKDMEAANLEMQRHARECDEQCRALEAQAADFHERWRATAADNARLQAELARLREMIASHQVQPGAKAAAAAPAPASAARAQSSALLDTLLPVEPMAEPLGTFCQAPQVA